MKVLILFFKMTSELQTPKEWFKVKSESETVPEEREWPFRSSSLEKLSQRLAEKAHLLTKTRKRQERTFWNTRSSLLGTDDCPNQPSVCKVTEIPTSALEDNWWSPSWCKEELSVLKLLALRPFQVRDVFLSILASDRLAPSHALEPNPSSFLRSYWQPIKWWWTHTTELIKVSSYLTLQPMGTGSCLPASPCCWHGKMATDQATQEKQQAEGQCYCWGLPTTRQLLPKEGREKTYSPLQQRQKEPKPQFPFSLKGGKQIFLETVSVTWARSIPDVVAEDVRMQTCAAFTL